MIKAILFHTAATAIMAYGYLNLKQLPVDKFINTQKGGHSQFLTIIGLWMACANMTLGLVSDLLPTVAFFRKSKRLVLMIALPIATIVTTVYWTLLIFWTEMILAARPIAGDSSGALEPSSSELAILRIPLKTDLALHAVPAISLLVDFFFVERRYSHRQAVWGGIAMTVLACSTYAPWIEYCSKFNGSFPYPFLTDSPFDIRVMIYVGLSTFALVTFWVLNALHS
ncbi:FAR-17a/AIG1-like protein [Fomitopsis betulina]|nr:FAR-17a/AIG1-like protein [Fomitopsis betulina]